MSGPQVVIVGGGAAGFFAAIICAESRPEARVTILERGPQFLSKVRISGGGRCNVTHHCFDARELASRYPRGGSALIGPFQRFQPLDTAQWFLARGVRLKTEQDGRMFPESDSSQTIIDCLMSAAQKAGVELRTQCGLDRVERRQGGGFKLHLTGGEVIECDRLLLATGGCRAAVAGHLAVELGHTLVPPVPSLFSFEIALPWLGKLSGISVNAVELAVPAAKLKEKGPMLITHRGVTGPAVLKLSAWGARELHDLDYKFILLVNWLPLMEVSKLTRELDARRNSRPAMKIVNAPIVPLAQRLWEALVVASGLAIDARWADLSSAARHKLVQQLIRCELPVAGKSLNKDEFVTCGGVKLGEVKFDTMESRICPGLHFAGELLDIDGITGGFNFQAAWTTGWLAGKAMAQGSLK